MGHRQRGRAGYGVDAAVNQRAISSILARWSLSASLCAAGQLARGAPAPHQVSRGLSALLPSCPQQRRDKMAHGSNNTTTTPSLDVQAVGIAASAYAKRSGDLMTLIDDLRKSGAALDVPLPRIVVIGKTIHRTSFHSHSLTDCILQATSRRASRLSFKPSVLSKPRATKELVLGLHSR